MPEKTCSTCQCNKVCDHNKYGFENCGNYISADVVPRAETAREIFEEIDRAHEDCIVVLGDMGYLQPYKFEEKIAELKNKYTEEGK